MFSISHSHCLVMESHIGTLIKVLEVTFLPHMYLGLARPLYWPAYKKLSARWETICDHDIPAHCWTGAD